MIFSAMFIHHNPLNFDGTFVLTKVNWMHLDSKSESLEDQLDRAQYSHTNLLVSDSKSFLRYLFAGSIFALFSTNFLNSSVIS